ncbi:lymphocyte antigen 6E-like [Lissotriton helveticus]
MKVLLISLLAAALCAGIVHSLQCYTCDGQNSNSNCMTTTTCSSNANACQTTIWKYVVGTSITKSCSSSCTASNTTVAGIGTTTSCCSDSLCNISGATSVKMSYLLLAACMGFLGLLLRDKL